jgi:hypothetical protein
MTKRLPFKYDDGGRAAAGYRGKAGDCVVAAVAIATQQPYKVVYDRLSSGVRSQRLTRGRKRQPSARNGVDVTRTWFKRYMEDLGWTWTPTMLIGSGCRVHLAKGELPDGRLIVSVSRHLTAVIDQTIHDTYNPQRTIRWVDRFGRLLRTSERCVYGYWSKQSKLKHQVYHRR